MAKAKTAESEGQEVAMQPLKRCADDADKRVRERMKRKRQERSEGDQAEQYAGNNVDPSDGPESQLHAHST